jgi:hypothetical protein
VRLERSRSIEMWQRATWHESADELSQICRAFRAAHWGRSTGGKGWPRDPDDEAEMRQTSKEGIQLLRALATAVRSDRDFNLIPPARAVVGALRRAGATPADAIEVKRAGGYASVFARPGYAPLHLREALNKIVHADPRNADYYVAPLDRAHELLLYGQNCGDNRFAALSLFEVIKAIQALPDMRVLQSEPTDQ